MLDKFKREINYVRISLTKKCNLNCSYCKPFNDKTKYLELSNNQVLNIVKTLAKLGVNKIRLTGGEPLLRKDLLNLIKEIKTIRGIEELTLTTNGIGLDKIAKQLKENGLDRVNISLDTLNQKKYKLLTKKDVIDNVINSILISKKENLNPKVNIVLMKDINDDEVDDFINFSIINNIQIRFIELMPLGDNVSFYKSHFLRTDFIIDKYNLLAIETDSLTTDLYTNKENNLKLGLINPISHKFCFKCNRIRITSEAKLKLCLHSDVEIDFYHLVDDLNKLEEFFKTYIYIKDEKHHIDDNFDVIHKNMYEIGG